MPSPPAATERATVVNLPTAGSRHAVTTEGPTPERSDAAATKQGDAPFQVNLPKALVRQIRVRAAEEGTTHRAIVLRALKLYGFTVPEGQDVDRRKAGQGRR